ncbi:MAG: M15 family metallopeptidase [Peptococcaceae bacterium]|nr:M15 family metallopeptidase [Peptococcaceae bacterium]
MPADGDVVRAFRQAGFVWGGDAWYSSHDYMHFSYLGG